MFFVHSMCLLHSHTEKCVKATSYSSHLLGRYVQSMVLRKKALTYSPMLLHSKQSTTQPYKEACCFFMYYTSHTTVLWSVVLYGILNTFSKQFIMV